MRRDLFIIPHELSGIPLFGFGWLLLAWIAFAVLLLLWLVRRYGWNAETRSYLPVLAVVGVAIAWLFPLLEQPAPDGATAGLPIRGYGVMLLGGIVAGVGLAMREARRAGLDPELILSLAFHVVVGGLLGARTFYVVEYWDEFQRDTLLDTLLAIANVTQGGLVVYGSFVGAVVAAALFFRRHRLSSLAVADLLAPSLMVGLAIGRIGCLLNGCCYGGVCEHGPLAMTFPANSPPYEHQRQRGELHGFQIAASPESGAAVVVAVRPGGPAAALRVGQQLRSLNGTPTPTFDSAVRYLAGAPAELEIGTDEGIVGVRLGGYPPRSLPVHPTQLYSSLNAALIGLFLWAWYPFRQRDGEVFAILLTIYPLTRFLLEAVRTDEPGQFGTGLTVSQLLSLMILAANVALWVVLLRRPRRAALPAAAG